MAVSVTMSRFRAVWTDFFDSHPLKRTRLPERKQEKRRNLKENEEDKQEG